MKWNQRVLWIRGLRGKAGVASGFRGWLSGQRGYQKVACLDSTEESTLPEGQNPKQLIMSQNSGGSRRGGFQVASPVKKPRASEMPR